MIYPKLLFLRKLFVGNLLFSQIGFEHPVKKEGVQVGSQAEAEEKPAECTEGQKLYIPVGHIHREQRKQSYDQSGRKVHECEEKSISKQVLRCVGESSDYRENVQENNTHQGKNSAGKIKKEFSEAGVYTKQEADVPY